MNSYSTIEKWISEDSFRMECLHAVDEVFDGEWYIGAGFVRNLIWDKLHTYRIATVLNDVDIIFCNPQKTSELFELEIQESLSSLMPNVNWSVTNQIRMAHLHGHEEYKSCSEAMSYWPEIETAVAVTLNSGSNVKVISPYFASELVRLTVSRNRRCTSNAFSVRCKEKGWQTIWPKLRVKF